MLCVVFVLIAAVAAASLLFINIFCVCCYDLYCVEWGVKLYSLTRVCRSQLMMMHCHSVQILRRPSTSNLQCTNQTLRPRQLLCRLHRSAAYTLFVESTMLPIVLKVQLNPDLSHTLSLYAGQLT